MGFIQRLFGIYNSEGDIIVRIDKVTQKIAGLQGKTGSEGEIAKLNVELNILKKKLAEITQAPAIKEPMPEPANP